ncbi:Eukaryotic translation initiation factor 3 subunit G [Linum grandiflorum]
MTVDTAAPGKLRWGELEDDGEDLDFLLPPKEVIGPDDNGIKRVIEYKFNDDGNKVKITTTTRVRKLAKARLSRRAMERRNWAKFGDAVHEDVGARLTMVSTEEILLERPRAPGGLSLLYMLFDMLVFCFLCEIGVLFAACIASDLMLIDLSDKLKISSGFTSLSCLSSFIKYPLLILRGTKAEENKMGGDNLSQLGKAGAVLMLCRSCGKKGDHWTSRCPYKDLTAPTESFVDKPPTSDAGAAPGGVGKAAYVPPSMRAGADRSVGSDMRRRNDENSLRVSNLSEDTRDQDLRELFLPFGHVTRTYVAIDHKTGVSRGFGFVNFANKEDGERAISKLNGYGYDNLILHVEWATPRAN